MDTRKIGNAVNILNFQKQCIVDLGTSRTRVMWSGSRAMFDQSSLWIPELQLYGARAEELEGRSVQTRNIHKPVELGVISDPERAGEYLHSILVDELKQSIPQFLASPMLSGFFFSPKGLMIVPTTATAVERQGAILVGQLAGLRAVQVCDVAVAVSGLLEYPTALVCVLGAGMVEISLISAGEVMFSHALPDWTGDEIDARIVQHLQREHHIEVTLSMAKTLKHQLATLVDQSAESSTKTPTTRSSFIVRGKDQQTGLPISIRVESSFLAEYLLEYLKALVDRITASLEEIPASILVEVLEQGVVIAGGGAMLPGLEMMLADRVRMPVRVLKDPDLAIIRGAHVMMKRKNDSERSGTGERTP